MAPSLFMGWRHFFWTEFLDFWGVKGMDRILDIST